MTNVNVFDVNDPRRAKLSEQMENQANAYETLMGGRNAIMGNAWDPWNQLGISWSIYNEYKNRGYSDAVIENLIKTSKPFLAIEKIKKRIEDYKTRM